MLVLMVGCDGGGGMPDVPVLPDTSFDGGVMMPDVPPEPFALTTTAFEPGAPIPLRYECSPMVGMGPGQNVTPDLAWNSPIAEPGSFALVMDDVDSGVVHWVVYDIPADVRGLDEGLRAGYMLAAVPGARQGEIQNTGYFGYFGPCSPASTNTYRWTLHVIATPMLEGATMMTTEYQLVDLIEAQSVESASFSGES